MLITDVGCSAGQGFWLKAPADELPGMPSVRIITGRREVRRSAA